MAFAMGDSILAAVAIEAGVTPAVLEPLSYSGIRKLAREKGLSTTDLRALAMRWGMDDKAPASPAKEL